MFTRISDAASAFSGSIVDPVRVAFRRDGRYWLIVAPFALAACGEKKPDHATIAKYEAQQNAESVDDGRIMCAQGEADKFARTCTIDREEASEGLILTVRHADGAFHRLLVTKDGRGVISADGAEAAKVTILDTQEIEVAIGGDRYRLPATVKPGVAKPETAKGPGSAA